MASIERTDHGEIASSLIAILANEHARYFEQHARSDEASGKLMRACSPWGKIVH